MKIALLDALTGRFEGGEQVTDVPEREQRMRSVLGNLRRLFNARQKGMAHVPEYGLPDLSDISPTAHEKIEALRGAIRDAVERYEPRLRNVRVQRDSSEGDSAQLVFLLVAEMHEIGRVRFQTTIRSSEPVEIHTRGVA
ncbi:MAG: type VI secretion system baseplate subunit TssE [Gemmatimonadaceae bacterium]